MYADYDVTYPRDGHIDLTGNVFQTLRSVRFDAVELRFLVNTVPVHMTRGVRDVSPLLTDE